MTKRKYKKINERKYEKKKKEKEDYLTRTVDVL
jgi:hypothetical protein